MAKTFPDNSAAPISVTTESTRLYHGNSKKWVKVIRDDGGASIMVAFDGGRVQWLPRGVLSLNAPEQDARVMPQWRKNAKERLSRITTLDDLQKVADELDIDINVHKYSLGMAKMQLANKMKPKGAKHD